MAGLQAVLTPDQILQQIQDNVRKALRGLQNGPLSGGQMIQISTFVNGQPTKTTVIPLKSGQDNVISHNLGHTPTLILIGAPNVAASVWNPITTLGNPTLPNGLSANDQAINLQCSANCTVSVWVS